MNNSLSEIFKTLESVQSEPVAPVVYEQETSQPTELEIPNIDLTKVDWTKFTIGGVNAYDLLRKAVNSYIITYQRLPKLEQKDALIFNLEEIYKIAGIDDVRNTFAMFLPEELPIVYAEDEDGYNWRKYLTDAVLNAFDVVGWDIEVIEDDRPTKKDVDNYINMVTYGIKSAVTDIDRHNSWILLLEDSLGGDYVVMSPADPNEPEDDGGASDVEDPVHDTPVVEAAKHVNAQCSIKSPQRETPPTQSVGDLLDILYGIKKVR